MIRKPARAQVDPLIRAFIRSIVLQVVEVDLAPDAGRLGPMLGARDRSRSRDMAGTIGYA
jgi:hypothetical protein